MYVQHQCVSRDGQVSGGNDAGESCVGGCRSGRGWDMLATPAEAADISITVTGEVPAFDTSAWGYSRVELTCAAEHGHGELAART